MPTDKIKEIISSAENKGPYGILAAIVASVVALAQLSPEQITRLNEIWPLVESPAGLLILSTPAIWSLKIIAFDRVGRYIIRWVEAYLQERATQTVFSQKINGNLEKLAGQFEAMLANHWDDRRYFDEQLERFGEKFEHCQTSIESIYKSINKRKDDYETN